MKGQDENKWDTDLEKQIYCHKQSTEILLVAMGGASNNLRAQLVILPLVLFFKVHCSRSYFSLFSCRSVGVVS